MFMIDAMSRTPVYEQLITQIERYIANGVLSPGDQLPSVRSLSLELTVNPNTIQKSYSELDARGIIASVPGRGCFVSENAAELLNAKIRKKLPEFSALAKELLAAGIGEAELIETVRAAAGPGADEEKTKGAEKTK